MKNSRNCIKKQKVIGPYELGQKTKATSYISN